MKYFVYFLLTFVALLMFLPANSTSEIRNKPLLILILSLIFLVILVRLFKYIFFMTKTKKMLKRNNITLKQTRFLPWASRFHGRYTLTFQWEDKVVEMVLLSRKRTYQRYHFDRVDRLEFYRANRVVFNSIKAYGGTISKLVEVKQVGKQNLKWDDSSQIRIVLFDKLPEQISDTKKKECLGTGDRICASDVYLLDWESFCDYISRDV